MTDARLHAFGITHRYAGRLVLDAISFELFPGEILSLLGPNGSGKSTLMKAVAGILRVDAGQVRYQGDDALRKSLAWRASRIAYVGADLTAQFPMTAEQAVLLGRSCQGGGFLQLSSSEDRRAVEDAMKRCHCWELRHRDLHTLSGGERQLVGIARSLAQGARVLLLDESFSRMDLHHQAAMGRLLTDLSNQAYSIVLVSHDINIASEWAHTALLLKDGARVAHGPIREVLNEDTLKKLYPGSDLVIGRSPVTGAPKVFFR
jgi:iron complex transport system ATP-binding protein